MSTPLRILSAVFYLTEIGFAWRQEDYDANKIVNALKGNPINGYIDINLGGDVRRFDQSNIAGLMPPLYRGIAKKLKTTLAGPFDVVPIPNSAATIENKADCRTFEHARQIAKAAGDGCRFVPALRWKQQKTPAHEGGSRDPQVHFENLQLVERPTQQCVIFDDVVTTGGQMIGAYRRLAASGVVPVLGIVVGRAVKEQKSPVMGWYEEAVETESSPLDWI